MEDNVKNPNQGYIDALGGFAETALDPYNSNVFQDWFLPATKEARQDSRQMAMDRASFKNKIQGMKEAGINPLTAAGGLAGTAPAQVTQPAASTNPIGDVAGVLNGAAGALNDVSSGVAGFTKLGSEKENIESDTFLKLTQGGLNQWSAESIRETLPLITDNMAADYYNKLATIEKTWQEYENLKVQHDNIVAELNLIIANESLVYSETDVNNARKSLIDEQTRWQKEDNDFWDVQGYKRGDPIDQSIRDMKVNGKDPSFIGEAIASYRGQVKGAEARAQYSAEAEFANSIAIARRNGENASDVLYGRIGSPFDLVGRISYLGTNLITSTGEKVTDFFKSRHTGKELRQELTMCLNSAFEQLDKFPGDENARKVVTDLQQALQLSNSELVQWAEKNWSN